MKVMNHSCHLGILMWNWGVYMALWSPRCCLPPSHPQKSRAQSAKGSHLARVLRLKNKQNALGYGHQPEWVQEGQVWLRGALGRKRPCEKGGVILVVFKEAT